MSSMYPPKKNAAFTLYFSLYTAAGAIIANPGTMTRAVSIDGGAVDTTPANAVTEEDTTYGQISWVLSADEMNGDAIWVYAKDDTAGCVPFTATLYTAANTQDELGTSIASILDDTGTDGVVVSAASVAGAVWDEALAGHAGAGTAGAALSAAGTAGDPWSIDIPGAYADGTAGQKLGDIMDDLEDGGRTDLLLDAIKAQTDALDGYTVTVVSPVADSGTVTLYAGDDYDDAHGRALTFSLAVSGVPDLTAATVVMKTQESSWTATSCTSDGTDWTVLFEPTAADTAALGNLRQTYEVEATLSDGDVATLVTGTLVVNRDVA